MTLNSLWTVNNLHFPKEKQKDRRRSCEGNEARIKQKKE